MRELPESQEKFFGFGSRSDAESSIRVNEGEPKFFCIKQLQRTFTQKYILPGQTIFVF
jgi:hypothetical protein